MPARCRTCSAGPISSPMPSGPISTWASPRSSSGCPRPTTSRRSTGCRRSPPSSAGLPAMRPSRPGRVVLLAGGVGGARLAHGLQAILGPDLAIVVNTADDLEHQGLLISPDHDTVMYTLAGLENREWGWGIAGDTFADAVMLERYGQETWFRLGDRDLATHLVRTRRLRAGERATDVARDLQRSLGLRAQVLPMADEPVRTQVLTDDGWLDFQEYFVHRHQEPEVRELRFNGAEEATATPEVL